MNSDLEKYIEYLQKERKYSEQTLLAYRTDVLSFLDFLATEVQVDHLQVEYDVVRAWIVSLSEAGMSNRSINRKTSALKSFYGFLFRLRLVAVNPLKMHRSLRVEKKIQIPFSVLEMEAVRKLVEAPMDFEILRDGLVIELLYGLGIRRAELLGLKVADVDFYNNSIRILGKGAKWRVVPLMLELRALLQKYLPQRELVLSGVEQEFLIISKHGNKVNETFVYRLIKRYFSQVSSKEKRSPHMLRHTFATHLLNNGADINSIKELLGHSSLSSTQVYAQSSLEELKKVYLQAHPRTKQEE